MRGVWEEAREVRRGSGKREEVEGERGEGGRKRREQGPEI